MGKQNKQTIIPKNINGVAGNVVGVYAYLVRLRNEQRREKASGMVLPGAPAEVGGEPHNICG